MVRRRAVSSACIFALAVAPLAEACTQRPTDMSISHEETFQLCCLTETSRQMANPQIEIGA
jgi:hypothetical protein